MRTGASAISGTRDLAVRLHEPDQGLDHGGTVLILVERHRMKLEKRDGDYGKSCCFAQIMRVMTAGLFSSFMMPVDCNRASGLVRARSFDGVAPPWSKPIENAKRRVAPSLDPRWIGSSLVWFTECRPAIVREMRGIYRGSSGQMAETSNQRQRGHAVPVIVT